MAFLEDAADPHREGLSAGVTLTQARAATFTGEAADSLVVMVPAVGADGAVRPKVGLDIGESGFLVVKMRGSKNRVGHGKSPMDSTPYAGCGVVKCNVAKMVAEHIWNG
jgi:hypothetical protein